MSSSLRKRQEVRGERLGAGKDVLGAFQVPVLSLAASQSDDYCYQKAETQLLQDINYAVRNISPIIGLHHHQSHAPLHPTGYASDKTKYIEEGIVF